MVKIMMKWQNIISTQRHLATIRYIGLKKLFLHQQYLLVDGVDMVTFDRTDAHYRDASALYDVSFDGCSDLNIVTKIVLPLARPTLIVTGVMIVNFVWNEYIFSINFLTGSDRMTLASGLYSLQATETSGSWPVFAAASLVVSFPVLVIFFLSQKHMVSGLTSGGVKG